ncbi:hypothetical protein ADUPG1_012714 [Aduncisulcus paluster]|uniref:Protein kinase domain-containing protein n=1 Tax=Aduncisulcus paluster TaxID=2918883 RepID=A0ABQ5K0E0_9EUKA|nr:hypothetical protein ADUPG1_012714 [Aduncisulcus paluster]
MLPIDSKNNLTTSRGSDNLPARDDGREDEKLMDPTANVANYSSSVTIKTDTIDVQPISRDRSSHFIIPIPRDQPTVIFTEFKGIKFDHTNIVRRKFPKPASMKGAYILLSENFHSQLISFKFTSGKETTKKYKFPEFKHHHWFYLPIDLVDIDRFEMLVESSRLMDVKIPSLAFIREETLKESTARKSIERIWSKATPVVPQFKNEGSRYSVPISRDTPSVFNPAFDKVIGRDFSYSKELEKYYKSEGAKIMFKRDSSVVLSRLSSPFQAPCSIKGAYICVNKYDSSPQLLFTFSLSDGIKIFKFEFTPPKLKPRHSYEWHFLPIDLSNVKSCEIDGKGTWKAKKSRVFKIKSLVFIREETPEERTAREVHEHLWTEATIFKPKFMNPGKAGFIPIPRDDPTIIIPSFELVKGKNDSMNLESEEYDQSSEAQKMLKGEGKVSLSHLSIPFTSPSPMKGAYICVDKNYSSPQLLFTFTVDSDDKTISKKYEFTRPKNEYEWHFLSIDLDNVVLCEIEGKGTWKMKFDRCFCIHSLVFLKRHIYTKEVTFVHEGSNSSIPTPRDAPTCVPKREICHTEDISYVHEGVYTFVHEGGYSSIPIPRDAQTIISPAFDRIVASNEKYRESCSHDRSSDVQKVIKGGYCRNNFTHISIPFTHSTSIKGIYICLPNSSTSKFPEHLNFTFTSFTGNFQSFKFEFIPSTANRWYFLSIDLFDVTLCEIEGESKQEGEESFEFSIESLAFVREETPEETLNRQRTENQLSNMWFDATPIIPEFKGEGGPRSSPPIPFDDLLVINPSFELVKGKNDSMSKESEKYDMSSEAQKMLIGEDDGVILSHLSIPFPALSPMKGAYICVEEDSSSPSLLFSFTLSNGEKIPKKYEFTQPKHDYEWHFLRIDLPNVVLCEVRGKGMWGEKNSRPFQIKSLIFITGDDIPPLPSDSSKLIKHDSFTLTSSATITPQCVIGHGGFAEVLLVKVEGIPIPCVLKKMLRKTDEKVMKDCQREFKVQRKLFNNSKCFNRIPRPLYILDLLDADLQGIYGFLMEFCIGGSVSSFAKKWCVVDKSESQLQGDGKEGEEEECSSSEEDSDDHKYFDPMTLNPVKVSALCVGMIECLDDVFTAKLKLIHRDIKPDNFLVRVDSKDGECTVVLSDLGLAQILDSISSSSTTKSGLIQPIHLDTKKETQNQTPCKCGTLVYNSYETLLAGTQTQKSDGYSLGMSILALFICEHPFVSLPIFNDIFRNEGRLGDGAIKFEIMKTLIRLMENNMCPSLLRSPLFKSLLTLEGGKFQPVHECLNEVFTGLTQLDVDKRMSVHKAREKVQSIKHLLPEIGEGFECPSVDDIIREQKQKHFGYSGSIIGGPMSFSKMQDSSRYPSETQSSTRQSCIDGLRYLTEKNTRDIPSCLQVPEYDRRCIQSSFLPSSNPFHGVYSKDYDESEKSERDEDKEQETRVVLSPQSTVEFHREEIQSSQASSSTTQSLIQRKKNISNVIKHDSFTLTSSATITHLDVIGHGGFGEVLLVKVEGIPIPCVLKKMLRKGDEKVVMYCREEFEMQQKLFKKCFEHIPRPLYILDLLDGDMKGVFGFVMEYCAGGNVKDFLNNWCYQAEYSCIVRESSLKVTESGGEVVIYGQEDGENGDDGNEGSQKKETSDNPQEGDEKSDEDQSKSSSRQSSTEDVEMTLEIAIRICAMCVAILECFNEILKANPNYFHGNVSPTNFLVRVDPTLNTCTVVLDASTSRIQMAVRSEYLAGQFPLWISISLISCCSNLLNSLMGPFVHMQYIQCFDNIESFYKELDKKRRSLSLFQSPVYQKLNTSGDKYKPLLTYFGEIINGLICPNPAERMSVHEACERVQSIKELKLLPPLGEGLKFDIIQESTTGGVSDRFLLGDEDSDLSSSSSDEDIRPERYLARIYRELKEMRVYKPGKEEEEYEEEED